MTTPTCPVCGAAEQPGRDHTCPVCGADLPELDDTQAPGTAAPPPPPAWPAPSAEVPPPPPGASGNAAPPGPSAHDPSHPSGLSSSLRSYGMFTHLSSFLGALVALAFVGPLVMWLIRRDEHPFLDHHGKEALNFNLSMLLYFVVGLVASIATVGLGLVVVAPAALVLFVTWVVTTIVAAVRANAGEGYRYPLTIRFIPD